MSIRLVIFDLDGVIIASRDMHYQCLNDAIAECDKSFIISYEDHISNFDGLPTARKLEILLSRGLNPKHVAQIKLRKQELTESYLAKSVTKDDKLIEIFSTLKREGYKIHIASNAVKFTIDLILWQKGVMKYVDYVASNEDIAHPKPHPEIYLRCMLKAGVGPLETLIIEDSYVGRQGAFNSCGQLCPVHCPDDLTMDLLRNALSKSPGKALPRWKDEKMNILIPMAGAGSRFTQAGYSFPKPLIEIRGKPMIQCVVENLNIDAHYIFVVQKSHYEQYNLKYVLNMIAPGCDIVQTDGITEGAACTTLLAKDLINNDEQLLITNSDQHFDWDSSDFMYSMQGDNIDGGIMTFHSTHPKWSYVKVNELGNITEVQEKKPISEFATCGLYFWKRGKDYVRFAEDMIKKDLRVNGEFYVAPVYSGAIEEGHLIRNYSIKGRMWGLGTPTDLEEFLRSHP